jgi:peptide-methionine (S)-S-oxide reductase
MLNFLTLAFLGFSAPSAPRADATAVFAGGCYWGTEHVFEHVKGVHYVMSGFARSAATGTPADLPKPVEAVRIDYDPAVVSYKQLLEIFFLVAHDPTSWEKQGPDAGPEYRAVVFSVFPTDMGTAKEYMAALTKSKKFAKPIVTQLRALDHFTPADASQQDYSFHHLTDGYVVTNDIPKLARLKKEFPALYTDTRAP